MADNASSNVVPHPMRGDRASLQPLNFGGGDGTSGGMERIARLEARADMTDQRLTRIEDKLDKVLDRVGSLPTANGLWGMVATVIGVGLAIAGLTFAVATYAAG